MKQPMLDAKGERMLELLAQGASNGLVAKRMGYTEGTMRVYLCHLYRKLGVANKTEAVVWYLGRARDRERAEELAPRGLPEDLFGEMALQEGLYAALGVMSRFVGPHGRMWEVAMRLKGEEIDAPMLSRRDLSRGLWDGLLKADWTYAKRIHDEGRAERLALDSPSDAVLLAAMLQAGG
ncbi:MAG TPA: helix-turn-helix transcriptional regulator, partial [Myxococcota bacterium]|nr:helix-turn-helix transcriptional regulator [Myxococcota bacterium]